jgi:2-polyprenyl-3-methyl-5-hydroxy-6-metoxy-1,4-benzoquinol methylase
MADPNDARSEDMNNTELKDKYDEMHKVGTTAWFSDGKEERETIMKMGFPWSGLKILEIGCGEGDLCAAISSSTIRDERVTPILGIDYSSVAIEKAKKKYPGIGFMVQHYGNVKETFNRIVMQGVLEHLDYPFEELKWMIDNLLVKGGDVITSSPCFLNPRGIVWMTLDMVGAVMSKTDLHYLHPWKFEVFCEDNKYDLTTQQCDFDWGNGAFMVIDLAKRIPLAIKDGNLTAKKPLIEFMEFLENSRTKVKGYGATMVYRIQT